MHSLDNLSITLPLTNPVSVFALLLLIMLIIPILFNRLKLPDTVGLILAGALIGENGLNLITRNVSIELFSTIGILYIMFLAGLEVDINDFIKNRKKSFIFGLFTFLIPMIIGTLVSKYILGYTTVSSLLISTIFASHTLIAYPIIRKYGIARNRAVNIAVGGTVFTDTAALLVLAIIASSATGHLTTTYWLKLLVSIIVFVLIVTLVFPFFGRIFFKKNKESIAQYIFVMCLVFISSFLAVKSGIEPIVGAFLAGLALNRLIPHSSPLMNRLGFVGNALFIPMFLISVGMFINFQAFFSGLRNIIIAVVITLSAILAKYLAAYFTQKTLKFTIHERRVIFGLSNARAAVAIATVLIGYNIIIGYNSDGSVVRLLDDAVLNATIFLIFISCTITPFFAQKGAKAIANSSEFDSEYFETDEKYLIPINRLESTEDLVSLSLIMKNKININGLYVLNIVRNSTNDNEDIKYANKIFSKATKIASSIDYNMQTIIRYDNNIVNSISSVIKENNITDLVLGLHIKSGLSDHFWGRIAEEILVRCNITTTISKMNQPLATISRFLVVIPFHTPIDLGFFLWIYKVWNLANNTKSKLVFYSDYEMSLILKEISLKHPVDIELNLLDEIEGGSYILDIYNLAGEIRREDACVFIINRHDHTEYLRIFERLPDVITNYINNNLILFFPALAVIATEHIKTKDEADIKKMTNRFDDMGKTFVDIFTKEYDIQQ